MSSKNAIYCLNNPNKYEVHRETYRIKCKTRYDNNEKYRQHKIDYAKNMYAKNPISIEYAKKANIKL